VHNNEQGILVLKMEWIILIVDTSSSATSSFASSGSGSPAGYFNNAVCAE